MADAKSAKGQRAGDQIRALSSASVKANAGPRLVRELDPGFDVERWRLDAPGATRVSFVVTLGNGEQKTYEIGDANGLQLVINKQKPTTQAIASGAKKVASTIGNAFSGAYRSIRESLSDAPTAAAGASTSVAGGTAVAATVKK